MLHYFLRVDSEHAISAPPSAHTRRESQAIHRARRPPRRSETQTENPAGYRHRQPTGGMLCGLLRMFFELMPAKVKRTAEDVLRTWPPITIRTSRYTLLLNSLSGALNSLPGVRDALPGGLANPIKIWEEEGKTRSSLCAVRHGIPAGA